MLRAKKISAKCAKLKDFVLRMLPFSRTKNKVVKTCERYLLYTVGHNGHPGCIGFHKTEKNCSHIPINVFPPRWVIRLHPDWITSRN